MLNFDMPVPLTRTTTDGKTEAAVPVLNKPKHELHPMPIREASAGNGGDSAGKIILGATVLSTLGAGAVMANELNAVPNDIHLDGAGEVIGEISATAGEVAGEAAEGVAEVAGEAAGAIGDAADEVANIAADVVDAIPSMVSSAVEAVEHVGDGQIG